MRVHYWVMFLGAYMLLMGIVGYIRTGSPTAIFINGSFAVVTIVLGYFLGRNYSPALATVTTIWTGLMFLMMAFMTFRRIAAHANARPGSKLVFGSMALLALIVTIILLTHRPSTKELAGSSSGNAPGIAGGTSQTGLPQ